MKLRLLALALLLITFTTKAFAMTSEELVTMCKPAKDVSDGGPRSYDLQGCNGYVLGAVDMAMSKQNMVDVKTLKPESKKFVCLPDVDTHELVLVFLKYMDDHPAELHFPASWSIWNSLVKAYPCPK